MWGRVKYCSSLQAVNQSPSRLVEAYGGQYIFTDPGLFIHPTTAGKYIESWLRVHEVWFMRMAEEPSLALSNQHWRTFLSIDPAVAGKEGTKAAHRRQEVLDILLPNPNTYPGVEK